MNGLPYGKYYIAVYNKSVYVANSRVVIGKVFFNLPVGSNDFFLQVLAPWRGGEGRGGEREEGREYAL